MSSYEERIERLAKRLALEDNRLDVSDDDRVLAEYYAEAFIGDEPLYELDFSQISGIDLSVNGTMKSAIALAVTLDVLKKVEVPE